MINELILKISLKMPKSPFSLETLISEINEHNWDYVMDYLDTSLFNDVSVLENKKLKKQILRIFENILLQNEKYKKVNKMGINTLIKMMGTTIFKDYFYSPQFSDDQNRNNWWIWFFNANNCRDIILNKNIIPEEYLEYYYEKNNNFINK